MSDVSAFQVVLKRPHARQEAFLRSKAKRKVIRAGRRAGKTTGVAVLAVRAFLQGRRVLYAAPTTEQIAQFWKEVKTALAGPIDAGIFAKNETEHIIERVGTDQSIKAKTAWNADTLRGDYADLLILDEWQLMDETAWEDVGAPMLLDNNGDAVFVYTPPSLRSQALSRARDPRHAAKMYKDALREREAAAAEGRQPRWEAFHFTSQDNPHISKDALAEISSDMTSLSYRQEIMAEDLDEVPGALWCIVQLDNRRVHDVPPLVRVAVGIDPPGGSGECGIIVAGVGRCSCKGTAETHGFVLQDRSLKGPPDRWAKEAVAAYHMFHADRIFGEKNFGGDMVEATLRTVNPSISYQSVSASRGKAVRAEPIAALYEQAKVHHVGRLDGLENEMISWQPGSSWSPNRIDALVWVLTELMTGEARYEPVFTSVDPEPRRSVFVDKPDEHWPKHFRLRRDRIEGRTLW
jgi:hypothetical protein